MGLMGVSAPSLRIESTDSMINNLGNEFGIGIHIFSYILNLIYHVRMYQSYETTSPLIP